MATHTPPSFWDELTETPTRLVYLFKWGGPCCRGRGSNLERNNREFLTMGHNMITTEIPEQLSGKIDQKWWDTFVDEAEEAAGTFPAICGMCIVTCLLSAICASCYAGSAKKQVQALAEKHAENLKGKGIALTFFEYSPRGNHGRAPDQWFGLKFEV
jgi:hypothetical protein